MVQYSTTVLNTIGAPELSELTTCGAEELPELPKYLDAAIWNHIVGFNHPDEAVRNLDLVFLRRSNAASEEYRLGRSRLLQFISGLQGGQHRLGDYLSALTHFDQCIGAIWQAAELFNRMEHKILGVEHKRSTLFVGGGGSDLERINALNSVAKHFSAEQAEKTSTPIWITNTGLKSATDELSFRELRDNITALFEAARQAFVEIPKEAQERQREKQAAVLTAYQIQVY